MSIGFGEANVFHTNRFRNLSKIGFRAATRLNHSTIGWQQFLGWFLSLLSTLDGARLCLLLSTLCFKGSTWNFVGLRQKLKDGLSSSKLFQCFVVPFPMLICDGFLTTAFKVSNFGYSSSNSFGFHGKVIWQQGIKEPFAFDVMKSNQLISFKLPRINTFCNTLGKCKLTPLISLSDLSLQLAVWSPFHFRMLSIPD